MSFLNQTNFPRLWRLFQWSIGGSCHKRRIVRERLAGKTNVLEVGCSVGNIASVLHEFPTIRYTGIDIDATAIRTAQRAFRDQPRFQFLEGEIERADLTDGSFDLIVLSCVLHHVDDDGCRSILNACARLLSPDGSIVLTDPVQPIAGDPRLVRFFNSIEQGRYVRHSADLEKLVGSEWALEIVGRDEFLLKGSPLRFPNISRCVTLDLRHHVETTPARRDRSPTRVQHHSLQGS